MFRIFTEHYAWQPLVCHVQRLRLGVLHRFCQNRLFRQDDPHLLSRIARLTLHWSLEASERVAAACRDRQLRQPCQRLRDPLLWPRIQLAQGDLRLPTSHDLYLWPIWLGLRLVQLEKVLESAEVLWFRGCLQLQKLHRQNRLIQLPYIQKQYHKIGIVQNGDPGGIRTRDLLDENQIS